MVTKRLPTHSRHSLINEHIKILELDGLVHFESSRRHFLAHRRSLEILKEAEETKLSCLEVSVGTYGIR